MEMLWFWLVSVISVSPAGIREASKIRHPAITMEVCHD